MPPSSGSLGRLFREAAVGFYDLVLTTLAIKAVHHVSGGKALLATLAPMGLIIVFADCVFGFLVALD